MIRAETVTTRKTGRVNSSGGSSGLATRRSVTIRPTAASAATLAAATAATALPDAAITAYTVAARHRVASATPARSSRRVPCRGPEARTHASTPTRQTATTGGLIQNTARHP